MLETRHVLPPYLYLLTIMQKNSNSFLKKEENKKKETSLSTGLTYKALLSPFRNSFQLVRLIEIPTRPTEYDFHQRQENCQPKNGVIAIKINQYAQNKNTLRIKNIEIGQISSIGHENSYREIALLSETERYYFVINIMHESVNLSPSRYGLRQFNGENHPIFAPHHPLKIIGKENRLVYIGNFSTFAVAKAYRKNNPL